MEKLNNTYEKKGFKNWLRESLTLSAFIIISFIIALILMDIIIFPIAFLAVNNETVYTHIFKYAFWITIIIGVLYFLYRKTYLMLKDGFGMQQILKINLSRFFSVLVTVIVVLFIALALVSLVHYIFQNNYYMLYKIK